MSSVAEAGETYAAERRVQARRKALAPWLLMLPALVIVLIFFGLPTLYMVRMSFNLHIDQRLYVPGFTFEHYQNLFSNPLFTNAIWTTVQLALMGSLATVLIGYCFALLVWLKPARWRLLFIGLALCPLLISEIAIIFGWWMFFPKNGLLSYALLSAGLMGAARIDQKPARAKRSKAGATPPTLTEQFHRHRLAQLQRARTLAMLLIPFELDYTIPLRRAPGCTCSDRSPLAMRSASSWACPRDLVMERTLKNVSGISTASASTRPTPISAAMVEVRDSTPARASSICARTESARLENSLSVASMWTFRRSA